MTETQTTEFIDEIKAELKFLGEKYSFLSERLNISYYRLTDLFRQKLKFKPDEIKKIKNILGI